jgi:hypothetical protein
VQRGDQPEAASTMGTRQHVDAECPVHQGRRAPGTRTGGLHPGAVRTCGQRRRRGRGLGPRASIDNHSRAPSGPRGQHAMANQQVCFRPRRHRRQTLQELQRLEDQLPRPVVPRPLELQRDAPVACAKARAEASTSSVRERVLCCLCSCSYARSTADLIPGAGGSRRARRGRCPRGRAC